VAGGSWAGPVAIELPQHACTPNATACDGEADIVFVMDGSASVDDLDFREATEFLKKLGMSFALGKDLVRISYVQYSGSSDDESSNYVTTCDSRSGNCDNSVTSRFVLQELSGDANQICASISAPQIKSGTPILQGLAAGHCALKGSGRDVPQFVVLITDGAPSGFEDTIPEIRELAAQMRNESITIFSIAVGDGADEALMKNIASKPSSEFYFYESSFDVLLTSDFTNKFVEQVQCLPPPPRHEPRCECWYKADLLVCPLVQKMLDFECGGGYGSFFYDCTEEEHTEENTMYALLNLAAIAYKVLFVLSLRCAFGCHTIDLGKQNFLCFSFVNTTYLFLAAANALIVLGTYLSRCLFPVWAVFFVIFLHIDVVACIADRYMNRKLIAPPPPEAPRSNLELFAYTNHKKGWKDKAYQTVELGKAKRLSRAESATKAKSEEMARKKKSQAAANAQKFGRAGIV
jgi:hypothetical protein